MFAGEEGIESVKRAGEIENTGGRSSCEATNSKHTQMHAKFVTCAISNQFQKDQDVGREPSTSETTPSKTRKRNRKLAG